jgi:hypothetical protein
MATTGVGGGATYKKVGKSNQLDDTVDDIEMYDVSSKGNNDTEITEDNMGYSERSNGHH